jgi:hypothetical protein
VILLVVKKRIAVLLAVLLILTTLPGLALGVEVSLDLNRSSAMVGDSITASGSADPDEWVSIKIVDSSGNIVFYDAVKSDTNGNYSCTFIVSQVAPGPLTVVAGYGTNVSNKLLTITAKGDEMVAVTSVSLNKSSSIMVQGAYETLEATVAPANASNKAVTWSSNNKSVATVDENGKVNGVNPGTAAITVSTVDGNKTAVCNVIVTKQETATSGGSVTITHEPVTITVPQGVTSAINITQNEDLPLVEVKSGKVEMTIPQGTRVSGPSTIKLPEVMSIPSVKVTAAQQVDLIIKVGSDLGTITFTKPVRLVLKGQAGKSAGFIDNQGTFKEIEKRTFLIGLINDTDADAAGLALSNAGVTDGAVDSSNDLIIWTKHFTEFIAYIPQTSNGGSPGGGRGGSITPSGQTIGSKGGTVKEAGVEITFPANVVSSDIKVTVKKLSTDIPAVSSGFKLLGEVYEITSDKSSKFEKPVTITLPFDRNKVDNSKYDVGIYCWNNSQWVILDEVKADLKVGKVSGETNHFSKFAVLISKKDIPIDEEKEPVQDVIAPVKPALKDISSHWAEASINKLINAGAVSGYPDGTFKPDSSITRAEFAIVLVKALNLEPRSGKVFNDTTGHWAKDAISTAAAHGIVSGYDATTFGPDNLITREQMAVMVSKTANLSSGEGKTFADNNQIADWAKAAVAATSSKNIISGYPDNTFRPKANATRAEAVTVIVKILN